MSAPAIIITVGIVVSVLTLFMAFSSATGEAQRRLRQRATQLRSRHTRGKTASTLASATSVRRKEAQTVQIVEVLARKFLPRQSELTARLDRTGLSISFSSYLIASASIGLVVGAGFFIGLRLPLVACAGIGIALGIGLPHTVVGFLGARRRKKFLDILPDAIDLMVRGLRSGLPVTESIATAGREMADPVGSEFRSVSDSVRLGAPLEEVLWQTAKRLQISEFNFFVISLSIQQETGGNLAETLSNLSDILRKRRQMRLKVKALCSEARAGAYILGALPFVVFGAMNFLNPDYPSVLYSDPRGHTLLMIGGGMLCAGFITIVKLVRFEI